VTHYHFDHAGGNKQMKALYPHLIIIGSKHEPVPCAGRSVEAGDVVTLGSGTRISVLAAPCHTRGHVMYHIPAGSGAGSTSQSSAGVTISARASSAAAPDEAPTRLPGGALFTGDTLFVGGVGKFFEGGAADMHDILYRQLARLPDDTAVFCGHEYTTDNLRFACFVEPANQHTRLMVSWHGKLLFSAD
jgi:hydroxyacylglutathione hydrolase